MMLWRVLALTCGAFPVWTMCFLSVAWGECRLEKNGQDDSPVMERRLMGACTDEERLAFAVKGEELLQALREGRGVELEGIVLMGDVMLDQLPEEAVTPEDLAIPMVGERLSSGRIERVRRLHGHLSLRRVEVRGVIATNFVRRGYLIVEGPVSIRDSTVQRSIDFSRTAFLNEVELSGTQIRHEAFFIQSVFTKGVGFEQVSFGIHTRFHKAIFGARAIFTNSAFEGLAELLEVAFHQEAEFSGVRFKMGTGFSGSQFHRSARFRRAAFEKEAFFRFAEFAGKADFQQTSFGAAADFTEARFEDEWDFTGAQFGQVPQFPKAQAEAFAGQENRGKKAKIQAGLFGIIFLALLVVIYRARRAQRKKPPILLN